MCTTSSTAHSQIKCTFAAFRGVLVTAERQVGLSVANLLVLKGFLVTQQQAALEKHQLIGMRWINMHSQTQNNKQTGTDPQNKQRKTTHAGKGRGVSQSDPYHHLPCKAHLAGRPAPQTSAISTHVSVMRHISTLSVAHLAREAPLTPREARKPDRGSWNHWILMPASIPSRPAAGDFSRTDELLVREPVHSQCLQQCFMCLVCYKKKISR